jgi:hypothetical protein
MKKKPSTFESGLFDFFSSIPHMKRIMKIIWKFTLFWLPANYFVGFLQGGIEIFQETGAILLIAAYIAGSIGFGYMFHRWDKYDQVKQTSS